MHTKKLTKTQLNDLLARKVVKGGAVDAFRTGGSAGDTQSATGGAGAGIWFERPGETVGGIDLNRNETLKA